MGRSCHVTGCCGFSILRAIVLLFIKFILPRDITVRVFSSDSMFVTWCSMEYKFLSWLLSRKPATLRFFRTMKSQEKVLRFYKWRKTHDTVSFFTPSYYRIKFWMSIVFCSKWLRFILWCSYLFELLGGGALQLSLSWGRLVSESFFLSFFFCLCYKHVNC